MSIERIELVKEREFKDTVIGEVPKDWKVVKVKDISKNILTGATPLRANKAFWENGEIPWLTNEEVKEGKVNYIYDTKEKVTKIALEKTNIKLIPPNSLILSLTASVGKVAINKIPITTNQQFNSFVLDTNKVVPEFLAYYFIFAKKRIELLGGLTTFKFISKSQIANFQIPLPSLLEQQKIAEILGKVDETIQKTDEIIAKIEKLKKGLMQELLTKGIGHKEFKDTEIGRIPKEWDVVRLGDIGIFQYGITISAKEEDTGIKFLRITDIKDHGVDWSNVPYCAINELELKKYELKVGDVLFARIGATTGKTCYIDRPVRGVFGSYLIRFRPSTDVLNMKFLYFFTQSDTYWMQVNKMKEGQLKKGLNIQLLGKIKIPLPPLSEQQKISEILSKVYKNLEIERKEKEKLERIKKGLMDLLLTGKIRVKVS